MLTAGNFNAVVNKPFPAKLTDGPDADGLYAWTEQIPTSPNFAGWEDYIGGRSGDQDTAPAYEANDAEVPVGTVVQIKRAYFDPDFDWVYVFDAPALSGSITSFTWSGACLRAVDGPAATNADGYIVFDTIDQDSDSYALAGDGGYIGFNFLEQDARYIMEATVSVSSAYPGSPDALSDGDIVRVLLLAIGPGDEVAIIDEDAIVFVAAMGENILKLHRAWVPAISANAEFAQTLTQVVIQVLVNNVALASNFVSTSGENQYSAPHFTITKTAAASLGPDDSYDLEFVGYA